MKLHTDGDRFGIETDPHDAELVAAARDTAKSLLSLADAAGLTPDTAAGECDHCGDEATLRPLVIAKPDGTAAKIGACRDCQTQFAEDKIRAVQQRNQAQAEAAAQSESDSNSLSVDIEGE